MVRTAGLTGLMQMRHDPSLWQRCRDMLRAAVQRNFPKADVHAGLNAIDRNRSFAAGAPQVRVADFLDISVDDIALAKMSLNRRNKMEFCSGHVTREQAILELFTATFSASEGVDEGKVIGDFVRDLMATLAQIKAQSRVQKNDSLFRLAPNSRQHLNDGDYCHWFSCPAELE